MPADLPLPPQSALEQAALDLLRSELGYSDRDSARTFDARPPPRCGAVFLAVWSDGARESKSRTALDEVMGLRLTLTVRLTLPFDRWAEHRVELERRLDAARAVVHRDSWDHRIRRAAEALAGLGTGEDRRVGFTEALAFDRYEPWREVAGDWFHADGTAAGISQTAAFGKARRVQAILTAR